MATWHTSTQTVESCQELSRWLFFVANTVPLSFLRELYPPNWSARTVFDYAGSSDRVLYCLDPLLTGCGIPTTSAFGIFSVVLDEHPD